MICSVNAEARALYRVPGSSSSSLVQESTYSRTELYQSPGLFRSKHSTIGDTCGTRPVPLLSPLGVSPPCGLWPSLCALSSQDESTRASWKSPVRLGDEVEFYSVERPSLPLSIKCSRPCSPSLLHSSAGILDQNPIARPFGEWRKGWKPKDSRLQLPRDGVCGGLREGIPSSRAGGADCTEEGALVQSCGRLPGRR